MQTDAVRYLVLSVGISSPTVHSFCEEQEETQGGADSCLDRRASSGSAQAASTVANKKTASRSAGGKDGGSCCEAKVVICGVDMELTASFP
jgi:hypothetical protein